MEVLLFAVPVALLISLLAVLAFIYQVKSGQFDDLETPPLRMLFDDVEVQKNTSANSSDEASANSSDEAPVDKDQSRSAFNREK